MAARKRQQSTSNQEKIQGKSRNIRNMKARSTQPAFTRSKLTIETIEQGVKYFH